MRWDRRGAREEGKGVPFDALAELAGHLADRVPAVLARRPPFCRVPRVERRRAARAERRT